MPLAVSIDESPSPEDINVIAQGMRRDALVHVGHDESQPLAAFARENGKVVGGAVARIIRGRMFVDLLWVEETWRNRGVGSKVLEAMERLARQRDCRDISLETLSVDAARLYVASGYRLVAEVPDYLPGFAKHIFLKSLP